MIRNTVCLAITAIFLGWSIQSCAKKKGPEDMASAEGEMTESQRAETSAETSMEETDTMSSMPIIYFDYDQSTIRSEGRSALQKAAEMMKKEKMTLTIEGHCDERGSSEYNLALGERRAQAVKSYLRTLGVGGNSLSTISFGEERPADSGSNETAWARNRRAELISNQ